MNHKHDRIRQSQKAKLHSRFQRCCTIDRVVAVTPLFHLSYNILKRHRKISQTILRI